VSRSCGTFEGVPTVHGFDDLELDTALFELRQRGAKVPLEPQAFDVLVYLVSHRDRVVPKEELMDAIWGGRFVTEAAVTSRIKQVRRAVGDDGQAQRVIQTVHGRGYRFVAPVRADEAAAEPGSAGPVGPVRYTISDGLHIAFQVSGRTDGVGPDIVLISGFISHLELDWEDARHAHFLHRLGSMGRLIRFDKRGTGMSDRPPGVPDLETRIHDVLAVMDAVDSPRAVLFGYSEGGPMALLMAATRPERVASLILYAVYAKRLWSEDYPWAQTPEERAAYTNALVTRWDWEADARMRIPSADEAMQRWWAHRMRASATPSTVRALMDMNSLVDVRDVLPAVRVPTLVLHRSGDALFNVEESKYIADQVAGARFQVLDGADHFVSGNPDQILDAVEPFLSETPPPTAPAMALAALVAVSGPGSATALPDLTGTGGRVRQDVAGRPVLLFDGPAAAVRAALARRRDDVGMGIAVAEVEREAPTVRGPGVREATDIADLAPAGEIWLSATVGVLLAGSTIAVEPVGNEQRVLRPV
jgi:DNA-binding winged helix-turn-helix (wHTH) protein/alpha-beta hydrolase superfamily lysophospholipase